MDAKLLEARRKLEDIPSKAEYCIIVNRAKLTDVERQVVDMKYLNGKSLIFIGEEIGYSENTVKKLHHRALRKLAKLI